MACLSRKLCPFGQCNAPVRRGIATFLGCYEGSLSERDGVADPATLRPCLIKSGLDVEEIEACNASSVGDEALKACEQRASRVVGFGLGLPYLTIDGQYFGDDTTSLLPQICHVLRGKYAAAEVPNECNMLPLELSITVTCPSTGPGNYSYFDFERALNGVENAISLSARTILGNATFPTNFDGAQVKGISVISVTVRGDINKYHTAPMVASLDVLSVYQKPLEAALRTPDFKRYLVQFLGTVANKTIQAEWLSVTVAAPAAVEFVV